jgi:hypothetical protein
MMRLQGGGVMSIPWRTLLAAAFCLAALGFGAVSQEIPISYTFYDGGIETAPCRVESLGSSPYSLELTRVDVKLGPPSVEVNGAEPFYVVHGYLGYDPPCIEGLDAQAACAHLFSRLRFALRINGAEVLPSYLVADPVGGGTRWVYVFPAGYFAPGVYVFEGRHSYAIERQCLTDDSDLSAGQDFLTGGSSRACTVTILYPPGWAGSP